ncbi:hypothetical protein AX16_010310 [Volvariella volvacea WC 439]|nr:hypothetical protein AX16_010310 [Volvariella volvacea WC 439]
MNEDEVCVRCKAKSLDCKYVPVSKDDVEGQPSPTSAPAQQLPYSLPGPHQFMPAPRPEELPTGQWVSTGGEPDPPFPYQIDDSGSRTEQGYADYDVVQRHPHPQDNIPTSNFAYRIEPNHSLQYTDSTLPQIQPAAGPGSNYGRVQSLQVDTSQRVASLPSTPVPTSVPAVDSHHQYEHRQAIHLHIPIVQGPSTPSYPYHTGAALYPEVLDVPQRSPIRTPDSQQGSPQNSELTHYHGNFQLESSWGGAAGLHSHDRVPRSTDGTPYYEPYSTSGSLPYSLSNGSMLEHTESIRYGLNE